MYRFQIEENSILKFVRNKTNEFYPLVYSRWEGIELINFSPFIYCYEENQQIQRVKLFDLGQKGADVRSDAKNAIYLKGFKDAPIENIVLESVELNGVSDEAVLQNVKNLTFRNVFINGEKIEDGTINVDNNFNIN